MNYLKNIKQDFMNIKLRKKTIWIILIILILISIPLVFYAYSGTWNKTDLEFSIHINEKLVKESTFGESPTFAIWLEEPQTGLTQTIFVTNRAGLGDWEGKKAVPEALPKWFEVNDAEQQTKNLSSNKISERLTVTGATPKPGYFRTRTRVVPGSSWFCWIEVNLAGDFNENYMEYDTFKKISDDYKTGQPALLYKAAIRADKGNIVVPDIVGMCILTPDKGIRILPMAGITTAKEIFDEISITVVTPKPRILEWN